MRYHLRVALEQTPCRHRRDRVDEPRVCPFQQIVHNNLEPFCRCCDGCAEDCERAIGELEVADDPLE